MELIQVTPASAQRVWQIQQAAFLPLLEKYQDFDISPAMESVARVQEKMSVTGMDTYLFVLDGADIGSVRTSAQNNTRKIAALCVLPQFQGRGIAQEALRRIEAMYPDTEKWVLDTILQEQGNCHLYEKLGYVRVGDPQPINDRMTLVNYEKQIIPFKA